jgi:hypothetical protein
MRRVGLRKPRAGRQRQMVGCRMQMAGYRRPRAESRTRTVGCRTRMAEPRMRMAECRKQMVGRRKQMVGRRKQKGRPDQKRAWVDRMRWRQMRMVQAGQMLRAPRQGHRRRRRRNCPALQELQKMECPASVRRTWKRPEHWRTSVEAENTHGRLTGTKAMQV